MSIICKKKKKTQPISLLLINIGRFTIVSLLLRICHRFTVWNSHLKAHVQYKRQRKPKGQLRMFNQQTQYWAQTTEQRKPKYKNSIHNIENW